MHLKIENHDFTINHETRDVDQAISVAILVKEYLSFDNTFFLEQAKNIEDMFCFGSEKDGQFFHSPIDSELKSTLALSLKNFSSFESAIEHSGENSLILEVSENINIPFTDIYALIYAVLSANEFFNKICSALSFDSPCPFEFKLDGKYNNFSINHLVNGEMMPWTDIIATSNETMTPVSAKNLLITPLSSDLSAKSIIEKSHYIGTLLKSRLVSNTSNNKEISTKLDYFNAVRTLLSISLFNGYFTNTVSEITKDLLNNIHGISKDKVYGLTVYEHMIALSLSNSFIGKVSESCKYTDQSIRCILMKQVEILASTDKDKIIEGFFSQYSLSNEINFGFNNQEQSTKVIFKDILVQVLTNRISINNDLSLDSLLFK